MNYNDPIESAVRGQSSHLSLSSLGNRFAAAALVGLFAGTVLANDKDPVSQCPDHYASKPPVLVNGRLQTQARELCSRMFAVLHSGVTRTPLYAAERLTRNNIGSAQEQVRYNNFHPDSRLHAGERAELRDYTRSGFDRGHLAPSGDMPDTASQEESFALSNMIPQHPRNNRYLWSGIETATRLLAKRVGTLFVITGTIYAGSDLQSIGNGVIVPTHLYKALLDPATGETAAYVVANDDSRRYATIDLGTLEQLSGVRVFPARRGGGRDMELPAPSQRGSHGESYERVSYALLFGGATGLFRKTPAEPPATLARDTPKRPQFAE